MIHDYKLFVALLNCQPEVIITGSFLVNKEKANDIDIVMLFYDDLYSKLEKIGFTQTNQKEYISDPMLLTTWRKDDYNVIVVKDHMAFALWKAFSNIIEDKKYQFDDKEDRVYLHEKIKKAYSYTKDYL